MTKYFILLLIAASLFASPGLNSKVIADKTRSVVVSPTRTPKLLAEITRIELDKDEIIISCPPFMRSMFKEYRSPCFEDNNGLVEVKTIVNNPKKIPLTYEYTVTNGRIVGDGESAAWHLKNVRPGVHTVTVSIKGKAGVSSETRTAQVRVRECDCPYICICPTLELKDNGNVKAGEEVTFTANVKGGTVTDITYNWTVSQGEIIEGSGTPQIKVKTTPQMNGFIKATVEIDGVGLCESCPRTAFETATIIK